jgi:hypothetical protein
MIVRQSSLSTAQAFLAATKKAHTFEDLIETAKACESFVFGKEQTQNQAQGDVE